MQHHHVTSGEWDALASEPEFQTLLRSRRRFIIPATVIFLFFYLGLPAGIIFDPYVMRALLPGGLTVAYAYGLAQFIVAWLVLALYMREAKIFDEHAEAFAKHAQEELTK
jgi:uncharacterized membrane protein (DUF485 family)